MSENISFHPCFVSLMGLHLPLAYLVHKSGCKTAIFVSLMPLTIFRNVYDNFNRYQPMLLTDSYISIT